MSINRVLLATIALVGSLHSVSARSQASLICEDGRIRTESRENSALWACWTNSGCSAAPLTITSNPTWSNHLLTELYAVDCDSGGRASICYESSSGSLIATDSCGSAFEAIITVVDDLNRRRNLRGLSEDEDQDIVGDEKCEKAVEIDGETWVVMAPC